MSPIFSTTSRKHSPSEVPCVPELLEIEAYRRGAHQVVGQVITAAHAPDAWYLKRGLTERELQCVVGRCVRAVERHGKLLLLQLDGAAAPFFIGLRFGMTGRLAVDGVPVIGELEYGSNQQRPEWERVRFVIGRHVVSIDDPRRLGGVEFDPDRSALGPDAAQLTVCQLRAALAGSAAPLKARLLDQSRVAGLGNLLVDEALFRADVRPDRACSDLSERDTEQLCRSIRTTLDVLGRRGGSHTGDLQPARHRGASCPSCGGPIERSTVGGRTTYWCHNHQV